MSSNQFDMEFEGDRDIAWCPGCGNFGILNIVKQALAELSLKPQEVVFISGIGQAAKFPQYLNCHYFNGLHGRSLPPAMAIKAANPNLTVIAESGDGCTYGEGGNHLIHTILRNPNLTNIVHNNLVYGLTKGQASPTSMCGFMTPVQVSGVTNDPFNPITLAIGLGASFVARAFTGNKEHSIKVIKEAINHKGYALVDMLQPCVTFNKLNTYKWFKENTYIMEEHDPSDRHAAFKKATETDRLPLGIYYKRSLPTFEEHNDGYQLFKDPLYKRKLDVVKLSDLINARRAPHLSKELSHVYRKDVS
jgi:2-oxoglutarate ferredoxin oxidoreductase subunit beta